mmetsp:Transcript_26181/g.87705  ORF Transcript_26181/g.87705 Transcript_26181/m.87705 type:complete len:117 (+) Transcript_26181:1283-1633(+)
MRILQAWQAWAVYPREFIDGLEHIFLEGRQESQAPAEDGGLDGEDLDGVPLAEDDTGPVVDGDGASGLASRAALREMGLRDIVSLCEARGLSSAGSRAEMIERLTSAALERGGSSV